MRTFECACGARVYFENTACVTCGRELGYLPSADTLTALEAADDGAYRALSGGARVRKCQNYAEHAVCNWLVPDDGTALCVACELTQTTPDLTDATNHALWAEVEAAKRRLVYTLRLLGLPIVPRTRASDGLAFDIKADTPVERVLTGHADGLITLNVAEADPVLREKMRVAMAERYRTPLGHLRHECGHYYWDVLVRDSEHLEPFRALFGDERRDYGDALQEHYDRGAGGTGGPGFVSGYACAHPWEDWAETWAHYLHMIDTLETAHAYGLVGWSPVDASFSGVEAKALVQEWGKLTLALNALNRSMGLPDPYPFQTDAGVQEKLAFVRKVVRGTRRPG